MTTVADLNYPTILIIGAQGQVGFELVRSLQGLGKVVATGRDQIDLSDPMLIRDRLDAIMPSVIVNAAAYTAVDLAESEDSAAYRINAHGPVILAEWAKLHDVLLVHYSTDYVFDGTKSGFYNEDDQTNPLNVYGKSKLDGELAIAASGCRHLIFRTSWVYGLRGKNFLRTILRLMAERPELRIVADQIGAPTWSRIIATLTALILAKQSHSGTEALKWWAERSGVYHLTSSGEASWYEFTKAIVENTDSPAKPVIIPIKASDFSAAARRPANSRLANDKLKETFGVYPVDWRSALKLCMES